MTIERLLCLRKIFQIKIMPKWKINRFFPLSPSFENCDVGIALIKK